ncbi:MAG: DUF6326 family protein [Actinomycetota bacterium]|nr:DUF6326 family protein [Actinomycetota bacterium]
MTIRTNTPNLLDNPPSDLSEGVTTLRTRTAERTALEDRQVPVQAKLAAAWTSLMFLIIYIDYFHLYQPGAIDQIRGGRTFEFDITPTLLTIFVVVIGIPALMVMLSMTLPARANRTVNLVVASLYVPVSAFELVGESWIYFYGLAVLLEVLLLAFILRSAWTWPRRTTSPATLTASLESEPLRTPQQA